MATGVKRVDRVAPRMQRELAELLAGRVKDPRVQHVIVSRIELTADLALAKVYFRLLIGADDAAARAQAQRGLDSAIGLLRRELGQRMQLQKAPELRFRYDAGEDARARVDQLLEEIRREDAARNPEE